MAILMAISCSVMLRYCGAEYRPEFRFSHRDFWKGYRRMLIYVIRHGETELNKQGVMQGTTDEPLNDFGRSLAAMTGRNMKDVHFDACISSPLSRARETAEIVLRESGNAGILSSDDTFTMDERIMEIHCGTNEGKRLKDGVISAEDAERFLKDPFRFSGFPEGEDIHQLCDRTQAFLRELAARDDGKTYLVSTHGCALRAMLNPLYEDPSDYWHVHVPYNCVVNIIEVSRGKMKLIADDRLYYDPALAVDRYKI